MTTKTVMKGGKEWLWPEYDEKLILVFDQVEDIDLIMNRVNSFDVCIQAGGACGVWANKLTEHFDEVITFEPDSLNYDCLLANTEGMGITSFNAALGAVKSSGRMERDAFESNNCGAGYVLAGDDFQILAIDDLHLQACDLIQLDIEGLELEALQGAEKTIAKYKPVIVIEEKPLPHIRRPHTRAREYLESLGYSESGSIHRDVIFTC